jgi:hypothetical protein
MTTDCVCISVLFAAGGWSLCLIGFAVPSYNDTSRRAKVEAWGLGLGFGARETRDKETRRQGDKETRQFGPWSLPVLVFGPRLVLGLPSPAPHRRLPSQTHSLGGCAQAALLVAAQLRAAVARLLDQVDDLVEARRRRRLRAAAAARRTRAASRPQARRCPRACRRAPGAAAPMSRAPAGRGRPAE